jgi:ketosteroid isomerase-like protein
VQKKIFLCAAMLLFAACAWSQDNAEGQGAERDASSKIQALEKLWNTAEVKGDVKALDLISDDSMTYVDEDGSLLTKAQFLARVDKEAGTGAQWLVTEELTVHIYDDAAVVVGTYTYKGEQRGRAYQRRGRFIDTWVLKKDGWTCVVAQSTPILH